MSQLALFLILCVIAATLYNAYKKSQTLKRSALIDSYAFPQTMTRNICKKYPHLNTQQAEQVIDGLREYFHICNIAGKYRVAMPSQVVDVAWHEFILFTLQYKKFCTKALGRFLHHTPAEAMPSRSSAQKGIKKAWKIACQRENISSTTPEKLPLLFALDTLLAIPDGFNYAPNCKTSSNNNAYCASHIGCTSGCSTGCSSDSSDSSCDSSGCSGGCGGD
ncbi:MAG: hypothetical protein K9L22_07925 [Methylococcaceae bacterium]|nr:hypothetical protein [Methylococcaceae bacterium]